MKPIQFSNHARKRMTGRGATETEIIQTIQSEAWQPALENKKQQRSLSITDSPLRSINKYMHSRQFVLFLSRNLTGLLS